MLLPDKQLNMFPQEDKPYEEQQKSQGQEQKANKLNNRIGGSGANE